MSKRYVVASVLATASLLVAGCGGSSKPSDQTTTATTQTGATVAQTVTTGTQTQPSGSGGALTSTALIAKADLICAKLNAIRASNKINSTQAFIEAVNNVSANEHQAIQEMSQISPPASMARVWKRMIDDYKTLSTTIDTIKQRVAEHNGRQVNSLLVLSLQDERKVAIVAKSAGFSDCAKT